jgi:hypothetical protein
MSWTAWRLIATHKEWLAENLDYDGPSCYELATGGARGGRIQTRYVGETKHEKTRMKQYAYDGSHLSEIIHANLKRGWNLYYHGWQLPSKQAAVAMQNRLLARHKYDWNDLLNRD